VLTVLEMLTSNLYTVGSSHCGQTVTPEAGH
jgi:hypothetical protein